MNDNIFTPADSKTVKTFNSSVTFCESAHEVTREEKEIALDGIDKLIEQTKKEISNER